MSTEALPLLSLLAASAAIGLSLYAALAVPGLLAYFGFFALPASLAGLATPLVWLTLLALLGIEAAACRFRFTDLLWNAMHTIARPFAAFLLASAALADAPGSAQWTGAAAATVVAFVVHTWVLAVRTARRTAGPSPLLPGLTGVQLGAALLIATLAWTAPPFAAAIAAVLVLAPIPWSPRLWGCASMALSAVFYAVTRPDRLHRWKTGAGRLSRRARTMVEADLGEAIDTVRSAPVTLARLGARWPYQRGRLLIASARQPLFAHGWGPGAAVIALEPASGQADHGLLLETVDLGSARPCSLCLGPDAPAGPAVLAALEGTSWRATEPVGANGV